MDCPPRQKVAPNILIHSVKLLYCRKKFSSSAINYGDYFSPIHVFIDFHACHRERDMPESQKPFFCIASRLNILTFELRGFHPFRPNEQTTIEGTEKKSEHAEVEQWIHSDLSVTSASLPFTSVANVVG